MIGESWEFSGHWRHPNHVSLSHGETLSLRQLLEAEPHRILGEAVVARTGREAPFLIKFIDAADDLSIQVHPPDDYARRAENDAGKAEAWLILSADAAKDGGHIYLGFNPNKAAPYAGADAFKESFYQAIQAANARGATSEPRVRDDSAALVLPFLNKVRVQPGEVYDLPPGTIHAIGKGVRLLEIQQTSDITYRVWDWNRPDPIVLKKGKLAFRPLHIKKAWDVLDFSPRKAADYRLAPRRLRARGRGKIEEQLILKSAGNHFAAHRVRLIKKGSEARALTEGRFQVLTVTRGKVRMFSADNPGARRWIDEGTLGQGHTALIPASVPAYSVRAESASAEVIKAFVPS